MKKQGIIIALFLILVMSGAPALFAGGSSTIKIKNPIVLLHGWAGSDVLFGSVPYFWDIPGYLEDNVDVANASQSIFVANTVDAFNTDNIRGPQLRKFILQVLAITGAKKVNVVGHSMGGTTARYCAWAYQSDQKIASVTSVATPHRGTSAARLILDINNGTNGALAWVMNSFWGKLASADAKSRFVAATTQLLPESMAAFNTQVKDAAGVKYFSYADKYYAVSPNPFNAILIVFWTYMNAREGANDGVVPCSSMNWGEFMGTQTGLFGCDHGMIIGQVFGLTTGFDYKGFWLDICKLLSSRGY